MSALLLLTGLMLAPPPTVPRVAVIGSATTGETLEHLGWSVEHVQETEAEQLVTRLSDFDLVLAPRVDGSPDRWREFIRYGGVVILTEAFTLASPEWLRAVNPGLWIEVAPDHCSSPLEDAPWQDVRHPLLDSRRHISIGLKHPGRVSGRWQVLARCRHDRPALLVRELGDGLVILAFASPPGRFDMAIVENAWHWARDEGRINAAREREQAEYRALTAPRALEAKRADPPPVLDGIIEEDYWNRVARTVSFLNSEGSRVADQETCAFVGLDDYWLYVAFRCAGNAPTPGDERVVLAVDPSGEGKARREFGVCSDGRAQGSDNAWWQSAVQRTDRGWSAEMRVPLVALGPAEDFAEEWAVNFRRCGPGRDAVDAWAPVRDGWAAWGTLKGVHIDPQRFPLHLNHFALDGNHLSASFTKPSYGSFSGRYVVEVTSPADKVLETAREITVREFDVTSVETTHAFGEPGGWRVRARVEVDGGPVWLSETLAVPH